MPNKSESLIINSKEDLAKILAIPLEVLEKIVKNVSRHYKLGEISQKGKIRKLYKADKNLKEIQQKIDTNILDKIDFPPEINGGIKKRSRSINASVHVGKTNIARFDIKNFYPSTTAQKVFRSFVSIGIERNVSKLLTLLTTADNHLPVGFTTSPKISALVLTKLSRRIKGYLDKYNSKHTIWIDDITISGNINLKRLKSSIKNFVEDEGYKLNKDKTSFVYKRESQITTGINVNNDISAEKEKVKVVKNAIFVCGRFGMETYLKQYEPSMSVKNLTNVMAGRLGNLLSINREKYKKLQDQWKVIVKRIPIKE